MSAGFTPAPWRGDGGAFDGDITIYHADGSPIGVAYDDDAIDGRANAHLIAAAPELYDHLAWLLDNYDLGVTGRDSTNNLLAKARGEQVPA